jgi:hypothetical protein
VSKDTLRGIVHEGADDAATDDGDQCGHSYSKADRPHWNNATCSSPKPSESLC